MKKPMITYNYPYKILIHTTEFFSQINDITNPIKEFIK